MLGCADGELAECLLLNVVYVAHKVTARERMPGRSCAAMVIARVWKVLAMEDQTMLSADDYADALVEYLHDHSEKALYKATRLSQHFIESGLGPEDIIALHFEA